MKTIILSDIEKDKGYPILAMLLRLMIDADLDGIKYEVT
jgi:hypothetical protein